MEEINKGCGVYEIKLKNNDESVVWRPFAPTEDLIEVHIPNGAKEIGDNAFKFCRALKRMYMPRSMEKLGNAIFYSTTQTIEIYYAGTSEKFLELAKPYKKKVMVQVPGKYDVQPYCSTEGTYYKEEEQWRYFDSFCADCQVVCNDGSRLYYGYKNIDKKNC